MLKNHLVNESLGYKSPSPAKEQIFPVPREACHLRIHVESLVLLKPFVQFLEIPAFQREPFL